MEKNADINNEGLKSNNQRNDDEGLRMYNYDFGLLTKLTFSSSRPNLWIASSIFFA